MSGAPGKCVRRQVEDKNLHGHSLCIGVLTFTLAIGAFAFAQQPATTPAPPATAQRRRFRRPPAYPQRGPAPPAEVAAGKQQFEANCSFCHGSDARGGETGPNLVRAQVVLDDQHGEKIAPIVKNGIPGTAMPKFNLNDGEIAAIAAFIHSQPLANRGAPSTLDILVGNADAGKTYFNAHCMQCHSISGDLAGIGAKYSPKALQNLIVAGEAHGFGFRSKAGPETTVTVTLPSGETVSGKLDHLSAFVVGLTEADGTHRSFARNGAEPQVTVHDPLQWHIDMLPKWNDTDIHNLTSYLVTLK